MFTLKAQTGQSVNYQFFKALYCNGHHYLCDFSNTVTADRRMKYIVDIEIPGEGLLHVEMVQNNDGWQFAEMNEVADNMLERELSAVIYNHNLLH